MKMVWEGKVVMVFDTRLWEKNGGDSKKDTFFRKATILKCYSKEPRIDLVDVEFHHDGRISTGHFQSCLQEMQGDIR